VPARWPGADRPRLRDDGVQVGRVGQEQPADTARSDRRRDYSSLPIMTARDEPVRSLATSGAARRRDEHFRRAQRLRARRRAVRRRRSVAGLTLSAVVGLALWLTVGSGAGRPVGALQRPLTGAPSSALKATHAGSAPAAASPGSLPQTHAFPSGTSAEFKSLMASLWSGVVRDSRGAAIPAFFPQAAYVQLKSIAAASSDWTNRLVHDYGLDIGAAHALLGRHAASARLIAVDVTSSYGHWIPPGVCDNRIGYYEMPNARVVYREDGQTRSFGIASMISWRGVWYVVHFGAILRSSDTGIVNDPALGRGISAYSGTC
jgi:hypothetical protein